MMRGFGQDRDILKHMLLILFEFFTCLKIKHQRAIGQSKSFRLMLKLTLIQRVF